MVCNLCRVLNVGQHRLLALQGEHIHRRVIVSLVPTVVGVALASASDAEFCLTGLAAAIGSAIAQTSLNLTSKAALSRLGLSGGDGQILLSSACAVASLPLYLLATGTAQSAAPAPKSAPPPPAVTLRAAGLFLSAGLAYHSEYSLNFSFVRLVRPVAFSVTDVARRLAIIVTGSIIFSKPLTPLNCTGVLLALCGVLCFIAATDNGAASKRHKMRTR